MQADKPKYLTLGCKLSVLLYCAIIINYEFILYILFVVPVENNLSGNQVGGQIISFFFALVASFYNPLLRIDIVLILINLLVIFNFVPLIETKYSTAFIIKQIIIHNICFQFSFTLLLYFQLENILYYIVVFLAYFWLPITIYKVHKNFNQGKIKTIGSPFFLQKNYQSSIILIILCSKIWSYFLYAVVIYFILKWLSIIKIQTKQQAIKEQTYLQIQNMIPQFIKKRNDFFMLKRKRQQIQQQNNVLKEKKLQNIKQKEQIIELKQQKKASNFKQHWKMKQKPEDLQKPQEKQIDIQQLKANEIQAYRLAHKIKKQFAQGSDQYKEKWKHV